MGLFSERFKYEILKFGQRPSLKLTSTQVLLAKEIKENGYVTLPNFINEELLKSLVNNIRLHFSQPRKEFSYKGDTRHYAIERTVPEVRVFSNNLHIKNIGNFVMSRQLINAFTLGNHLISGNKGASGGGWHRDSTHPQFKAMLYLKDVNELNGPLEIIPGTHKFSNQYKLSRKGLLPHDQQWFNESEIHAIESYHGKKITLTGSAGTVILFESSTLHRGRPIEAGERLALTNYYYPKNINIEKILNNFDVS